MNPKILFVGLFIFFISIDSCNCFAQSLIKFTNPSFEGKPAANAVPPDWKNCGLASTPDTQPENSAFPAASEGKSYLSLVCRDYDPDSYEAIYQKLPETLKAGKAYQFTLDLAYWAVDGSGTKPAILRIWGVDKNCNRRELFWTSPKIDHKAWKKYSVSFSPIFTHEHLLIETYYAQMPIYWGGIFVDNLSPVTVYEPLPDIKPVVCYGDSITLTSNLFPGATYQWRNTADKSPSIVVKEAGKYIIDVKYDSYTLIDTIEVSFKECEERYFIPNLITPNGDNHNETFELFGFEKKKWSLSIYNRWGKLIYENLAYENEWKAEGLETGIYLYYLRRKESEKSYRGYIQVTR